MTVQDTDTGTVLQQSREAQGYDIDEAKAKIERVFKYLEELHRVKTPPIVHMDDHPWRLDLDGLPRYPSIRRGRTFGNSGFLRETEKPLDAGYVIKVSRPREKECPRPSVVIENWLKPGWDKVGVEPAVYSQRSLKTASRKGSAEKFKDSDERIAALDEWLERREAWERDEKKVVEALAVFSDLFDLWGKFKRESEKYQLFLADGFLVVDQPDGEVRHPLLLQRALLEFDPLVPEFTIRESADNPEVYCPLLRYLGVDGPGLLHVKQSVSEQHFHPLERDSTSQFFRDLVQRFWENGHYFEDEESIENTTGPYIHRKPFLYLGNRNEGFSDAIERYVEALPGFTELPESLCRIVGIETGRALESGESPAETDLLLTKDANPEQIGVIRRLEETGAVLVQGPPGTGKSHTIANLIGHLLAQEKSILVTSHASKALRVVREHVVKPLQALCVSLLDSDDESNKQLEESITGILNYFSTTNRGKLQKEIEKLSQKRKFLKEQYVELREKLVTAIADEYRDIEVAGDVQSPSAAARMLCEHRGSHDWIPGPLGESTDLPISPAETEELYALNLIVTEEDEKLLTASLPEAQGLPTPKVFAALYDEMSRLERGKLKVGSEYWLNENQNSETFSELTESIKAASKVFETDKKWIFDCLEASREGREAKESWLGFVQLIEKCCAEIPPKELLILEHGPKVKSEKPSRELIQTCSEIIDHLELGNALAEPPPPLLEEWQELLEVSHVDVGSPATVVHFEAMRNYLEVRSLREDLRRRWDRQMEDLEAPVASELGRKPEKAAKKYAEQIVGALNWFGETWTRCENAFRDAGFDWNRLLQHTPTQGSDYGDILAIRDLLLKELKPIIESRTEFLHLKSLRQKCDEWFRYLEQFSRKDGSYPLIKLFIRGIKKRDFDSYSQAWRRLQELIQLVPDFKRREELLKRLEPAASAWVRAIRERRPEHNGGQPPGDVLKAWKFRCWEEILTRQHEADLEALQAELNSVTEELHEVTSRYVERLAWTAQFQRTGLKQQQALSGWLALRTKIGKGTGKFVSRLKAEAKKTLVECRQAVPVWIMPLSRVVESFDIATTRFDVVILDEASQNDVLGLVALAIGKEVVVVGDHEQVSPYAVGLQADRIQALIDEMLPGIPNKQLYDGKTSVYDLARQSFGGTIRLLEHFRCVPDIIQFSNQLCYGGEIRPLREASASQVEPHLISHKVKNGVAVNKINKKEAIEIASLISAICRFPEYESCTIGVICMVGIEQALYIDSILRRRLSVAEFQNRRLLCGNASQFQGDERDIMFLSMVDSPTGRPLMLRQRDEARKVFNVAASRPRDQLWVVHSLNPNRDLKVGDLRLKLISHAGDPRMLRPKGPESDDEFASEFEKRVFNELTDAKFRATLRWKVADLAIDIVVEGSGGKRVAILCEGDRSQPPDELTELTDRQLTLERLGWIIIRLRGSRFFRSPERVVKELFRRLKKIGIDRMGRETFVDSGTKESTGKASQDLKQRIIKRADLIRSHWKDI